jgi:hypothetical protein
MVVESLAWIKSPTSWNLADYAVLILGGLAFLWIWLFRDLRGKALARLAPGLGLQFSPTATPDALGIRDSTFCKVGDVLGNCMRGTLAGRETVIFDQRTQSGPAYQPSGDGVAEQTVVGFRVPPGTYCRDRNVISSSPWHVEKIGEWIFVFQKGRLVRPRDIASFVEQARGWFNVATDRNAYEPTLLGSWRV